MLIEMVQGQSLADYFASFLSLKLWGSFLILNDAFLGGHLWYISALIYVLVMVILVDRFWCRSRLYKLIPVLLLLNVILGNYSTLLFGFKLPCVISRNFLLIGLPFFLLGDYLSHRQINCRNWYLILIAAGSAATTVLENLFLMNTCAEFNADFFLSTPFLACSLFLLTLKNEDQLNNRFCSVAASLGRNASTMIYIVHPILITVISKVMGAAGAYIAAVPMVYEYTAPFVVFLASTVAALVLMAGKKKLLRK